MVFSTIVSISTLSLLKQHWYGGICGVEVEQDLSIKMSQYFSSNWSVPHNVLSFVTFTVYWLAHQQKTIGTQLQYKVEFFSFFFAVSLNTCIHKILLCQAENKRRSAAENSYYAQVKCGQWDELHMKRKSGDYKGQMDQEEPNKTASSGWTFQMARTVKQIILPARTTFLK